LVLTCRRANQNKTRGPAPTVKDKIFGTVVSAKGSVKKQVGSLIPGGSKLAHRGHLEKIEGNVTRKIGRKGTESYERSRSNSYVENSINVLESDSNGAS